MRITIGELRSLIRETVESDVSVAQEIEAGNIAAELLSSLEDEEVKALRNAVGEKGKKSVKTEGGFLDTTTDVLNNATEKLQSAWKKLPEEKKKMLQNVGMAAFGALPFVSDIPGEATLISLLGLAVLNTKERKSEPQVRTTSEPPKQKGYKTYGPSDGPWMAGR